MEKILLIEDNPGDARLVKELFAERGLRPDSLFWAKNLSEGLMEISSQTFDAILLDLNLPESSGIDTFYKVKESAEGVLIILLTGISDENIGMEAIKNGSQDYLVKGKFDSSQLIRSIRYSIERKKAENRQQLLIKLLDVLNNNKIRIDVVREIMLTIKKYTGIEAIGIRLKDKYDFPYYETKGFSENFVKLERSLCSKDSAGNVILDSDGIPFLECLCGNVIMQRTNHELPFFTKGGSFWTNSTTNLLSSTADDDLQTKTRNRCNREGYESVALIPLRGNTEIIGLLQLNDHRKDMFDFDMIHYFESIGSSIGIGLSQIQSKEALTINLEKYKVLFNSIPLGVIVTDKEGKIVESNPESEKILGLPNSKQLPKYYDSKEWKMIRPNGSPMPAEEYASYRANKENRIVKDIEMGFVKDEDLIMWISATATPIPLKDFGVIITYTDITERKNNEKALLASEIRYRRLFETAKDGILIVDFETAQIIDINPFMLELLDYNYEDMIGKMIWELGPLKNIVASKDSFIELQNMGYVCYDNLPLVNSNGKIVEVEFISNSYLVGSRKVIQCNIRDITERNKMVETIRINGERLQLALEATSDALWDWNVITNQFYLSPRFYTMLGYEPDEFPSSFENWKRLLHPNDTDKLFELIKIHGVNERLNFESQYRLRSNNYEWRWISNRYKIVKVTNEGLPERIIGTIADITESKLNEIELKRTNRALKVLSKCNEILIKEKEEKILIQNICDKIIEIGGYSLVWVGYANNDLNKTVTPSAWAGNEIDYLLALNHSWSENERGSGPVGIAIRSGKVSLIRDIRTDQNYIPWLTESLKRGFLSVVTLPLLEHEHAFGILQIFSTEVNLFDKEEVELLIELANDLAYGILAIRTKEKHDQLQGQFLQSQKMEAIGKLTGGIAHDFNNILTVILVSAELLPHELDANPSTNKLVEQIILSTKKAAALTHQLLAFSRKQMVQPRILDLNLLLTEAQKMYQRLIGEDIDLFLNCDPILKNIKADPGQIDQIIMNMVVNAKDAMPAGGKLKITTHNEVLNQSDLSQHIEGSPGQFVCLEISDTGTGISKDVIPKIFDPFFTTKDLGRGTGLGLSVVYGIVKENKGWIELETEVGKGTIFKIYFPGLDLATDEEKTGETIIHKGHGEKIFVVEDDINISEIVSNILTNNGYSIVQSENIKKALIAFNNNNGNFDMVFMDVVLPDGSGIELYKQLLLRNPDLKVLFTSGYADEKARWSLIQENKYSFIPKPYKLRDLLEKIRNVISPILNNI